MVLGTVPSRLRVQPVSPTSRRFLAAYPIRAALFSLGPSGRHRCPGGQDAHLRAAAGEWHLSPSPWGYSTGNSPSADKPTGHELIPSNRWMLLHPPGTRLSTIEGLHGSATEGQIFRPDQPSALSTGPGRPAIRDLRLLVPQSRQVLRLHGESNPGLRLRSGALSLSYDGSRLPTGMLPDNRSTCFWPAECEAPPVFRPAGATPPSFGTVCATAD